MGKVLEKGNIVIFESTVYHDYTEDVCIPKLENFSGLTFNKDFFCGCSSKTINPGDKLHTITKIKKVTSGSNPKVAELVN